MPRDKRVLLSSPARILHGRIGQGNRQAAELAELAE
jgi:hypothetical protein